MNDYEVRFVFNLVNITTYVSADTRDEAVRWAEAQVSDAGIDMGDYDEVTTEVVGRWLV